MNEIHVLLICNVLKKEREELGIQTFIDNRTGTSEATIYKEIWRNADTVEDLKSRVEAASAMREAFFEHLGMFSCNFELVLNT